MLVRQPASAVVVVIRDGRRLAAQRRHDTTCGTPNTHVRTEPFADERATVPGWRARLGPCPSLVPRAFSSPERQSYCPPVRYDGVVRLAVWGWGWGPVRARVGRFRGWSILSRRREVLAVAEVWGRAGARSPFGVGWEVGTAGPERELSGGGGASVCSSYWRRCCCSSDSMRSVT